MQTLIFSDIVSFPGYTKTSGPYTLAKSLRRAGFTCQVVDFFSQYTFDELVKIVDKFVTPDTLWVGFSTTFFFYQKKEFLDKLNSKSLASIIDNKDWSIWHDIATPIEGWVFPFETDMMKSFFNYIRSKNPKIKIVIGGAKAQQVFRIDEFVRRIVADFYLVGKSELAAIEFTKWLQNPLDASPKFSGPLGKFIDGDKDYMPLDFGYISMHYDKNDMIEPNEYIPIEISRGCIFKCKFCTHPLLGKKPMEYTKTKEVLQQEFIHNYETFGTKNYLFIDETTNESLEKVEFLYETISTLPFKIKWGGFARLDLYHKYPEMAPMMKEIGLQAHFFGIETLNHESGKSVGKGLHPDKVKKTLAFLRDTWKNEVTTTAGFIIGLPHDTKEYVADLKEYLLSEQSNLHTAAAYPLFISKKMKSIFGSNPAKYGYRFVPGMAETEWINNHMSFSEAAKLSADISFQTYFAKGKLDHPVRAAIQNLGVNEHDLKLLTNGKLLLDFDYFKNLKTLKKNWYLEKILSL